MGFLDSLFGGGKSSTYSLARAKELEDLLPRIGDAHLSTRGPNSVRRGTSRSLVGRLETHPDDEIRDDADCADDQRIRKLRLDVIDVVRGRAGRGEDRGVR